MGRSERGRSWWRCTGFPRVVSGNGALEEGELFRLDGRAIAAENPRSTKCRKLVGSIVEDVGMRRGRMREHLVAEDLSRAFSKVLVQDHTAETVREPSAVNELLTAGVVRADVDEGGIETVTVKKAVVDSHGLGRA